MRAIPRKFSSPTRTVQIPEPLDEENSQINPALNNSLTPKLPPPQRRWPSSSLVEFEESMPDSSGAGLQIVPVDVASSGREEEIGSGSDRRRMRIGYVECKAEPSILIKVVSSEGKNKRKLGRPHKNESLLIESCESEREMAAFYESAGKKQKEMEVVMVMNTEGDVTVVAALVYAVVDPYGEELKRRTEGLQIEADFYFLGISEWVAWRVVEKE